MKSRKRKLKSSTRTTESESDRDERNRVPRVARLGNQAVGALLRSAGSESAHNERNRAPRTQAARLGNQAVGALLRSTERRDETEADGQQAVDVNSRLDGEVARAIQKRRGRGKPLPERVQREAESAFDTDFSHVRVHTGDHADELSRNLQAEAFTVGGDVFFEKDAYDPSGRAGRELLGHELAHTIQH